MRGFHHYDTVPHAWERIVASREELARENEALRPVADLCTWLAASPFRQAGLCGLTSMHDVIVGPSRDVLANPYLMIAFEFSRKQFGLRYEDGSRVPWTRSVDRSEIHTALERFFVKRARWYRVAR